MIEYKKKLKSILGFSDLQLTSKITIFPSWVKIKDVENLIRSLLLQQIEEDNKRFLGITKKLEWKEDCDYPVLTEKIAHNRCLDMLRQELRDKLKGK